MILYIVSVNKVNKYDTQSCIVVTFFTINDYHKIDKQMKNKWPCKIIIEPVLRQIFIDGMCKIGAELDNQNHK